MYAYVYAYIEVHSYVCVNKYVYINNNIQTPRISVEALLALLTLHKAFDIIQLQTILTDYNIRRVYDRQPTFNYIVYLKVYFCFYRTPGDSSF